MNENILKSREELEAEVHSLRERIGQMEDAYMQFRNDIEKELIQTKEQAETAYHSNAVFLSNMSHGIRVPMNGIIGMIDVILQTDLSEEQKEFMNIIANSSENLLNVIDDILDYSKMQTGQIKLEEKTIHLKKECNEVIELLSPKAKGKGLQIQWQWNSDLPIYVQADVHKLKQILTNLINNAIKYTKEGTITIATELITSDNNTISVKFLVADTGVGIAEKTNLLINKAFNLPGIKAEFSEDGMGLGLAICKTLTNFLKGIIGFESTYGKGSCFWFVLPLKKSEPLLYDEVSSATKTTEFNANLTILLVEDNNLNQKFACAALRKAGHTVDIAENGKIALNNYFNKKYDLILMDIQMPIMDGIEATTKIREYEKNNRITPVKIVAVTAYAMERDRERCINAGMDEFLSKPFKPRDLLKIIEDLNY
ncbi:MAG: response regulator [Lentimicrobiaceae bacterium]|nr:response regulator [Lentimicrobiaceae bacterium]